MPVDPITSIRSVSHLSRVLGKEPVGQPASPSGGFGKLFSDAIGSLNRIDNEAQHAIARLAAGEDVDLHQVMITVQEADIAFQLASQVRNKLIEAYNEVMRLQV